MLLPGCPICPDDELPITDGQLPVAPGQSVQFEMRYGDRRYSEAFACGLHWYVNGIEGGNDQVGTISGCGRYTAPWQLPDEPVWVGGHVYPLGGCADCCPGSSRRILFTPAIVTTESTASARRALRSDDRVH